MDNTGNKVTKKKRCPNGQITDGKGGCKDKLQNVL